MGGVRLLGDVRLLRRIRYCYLNWNLEQGPTLTFFRGAGFTPDGGMYFSLRGIVWAAVSRLLACELLLARRTALVSAVRPLQAEEGFRRVALKHRLQNMTQVTGIVCLKLVSHAWGSKTKVYQFIIFLLRVSSNGKHLGKHVLSWLVHYIVI